VEGLSWKKILIGLLALAGLVILTIVATSRLDPEHREPLRPL
jgi:hypothetical protein